MTSHFTFLLSIIFLSTSFRSTAQATSDLTIEKIWASPGYNGITIKEVNWSPDGGLLTYLKQQAGEKYMSLWGYNMETQERMMLVDAEQLLKDDQEFSKEEHERRERRRVFDTGITTYSWVEDGSSILIPLNGDIYLFHPADKQIQQLTKTEVAEFDPKFSPDGKRVAFIRNGNLFALSVESGKEIQLTNDATKLIRNGESEYIAQEEMDRFTGYWWSPDSKSIAYLQTDNTPVLQFTVLDYLSKPGSAQPGRYPKAGTPNAIVKVGVVKIDNQKTIWLDPGGNCDQYIARVNWLPDGRRISVQRQSRNQDTLGLYLYPTPSSKPKLLVQEIEPTWVRLHDNLYFFKDGQHFLWSSERSGYQHLFLYAIDGSLSGQITSGNWEVTSLDGVDEENKTIFFTATEKSPTERHLYSINCNGQNLQRLTKKDGWYAAALSPTSTYLAATLSSIHHPPQLQLIMSSGVSAQFIEDNQVPQLEALHLRSPEFSTIPNGKNGELRVMTLKPPDFQPSKKYPVIMYVYGGPTDQSVKNKWQGNRYLWMQLMAEKNFIVVTADNCGTPANGKAWATTIHRRLGDVEIRDQSAVASWLKGQSYVEHDRIGLWGWSYGGYLSCMAMLTTQDIWKAAVAIAPVCDWREYDTHYTERYLEHPKENESGYDASSPITYVKNLNGDLLIIHGMADDNVHFQPTLAFIDALVKANKLFDVMIFPGKKHTISGYDGQTGVYKRITNYFEEKLKHK